MNEAERQSKQVILVRTDLGMRRGKSIAQGAHASIQVFLDRRDHTYSSLMIDLWPAALEWLATGTTKIALAVDSEEELLEYHAAAKDQGLRASLIQDCGRTEFKGVPTYTAVAIGPEWSDKLDAITGRLRLL